VGEKPVRDRPAHAEFLNVPFCLARLEQVVRLIVEECEGPFAYVVTPNAQHVVAVQEQASLAAIYRAAYLSLCDSQIVRALAALDGLSLPLVTGSDLVPALLARQNAATREVERRRILIVGPEAETARVLHARYPNASIEVLPAPAGLAQRADLRLEVAAACIGRPWDILVLCVGFPAQEMIAASIGERGRGSGLALCAGASIDFVTGRRARAPLWLRRLGLEWAYRLACEPGRLWRRYLIESPKILRIFVKARRARH